MKLKFALVDLNLLLSLSELLHILLYVATNPYKSPDSIVIL